MKKRILAAAIIAATSFTVYQIADRLATDERGYEAFGGEELLFIFGLLLAVCVLAGAFRGKKKSGSYKATAITESEQSESNSP